jgi:hypothetical protein
VVTLPGSSDGISTADIDSSTKLADNIGAGVITAVTTITLVIENTNGLVTADVGSETKVADNITLVIEDTNGLVTTDVNGNASITDHIVLVGDGDSKCCDRQQDGTEEIATHFDMVQTVVFVRRLLECGSGRPVLTEVDYKRTMKKTDSDIPGAMIRSFKYLIVLSSLISG